MYKAVEKSISFIFGGGTRLLRNLYKWTQLYLRFLHHPQEHLCQTQIAPMLSQHLSLHLFQLKQKEKDC